MIILAKKSMCPIAVCTGPIPPINIDRSLMYVPWVTPLLICLYCIYVLMYIDCIDRHVVYLEVIIITAAWMFTSQPLDIYLYIIHDIFIYWCSLSQPTFFVSINNCTSLVLRLPPPPLVLKYFDTLLEMDNVYGELCEPQTSILVMV